jgi:putative N-acetylmannosamine-6-phosphate epimerase/predicted NBD/HSP70 family sugar kinase
LKLKIPDSLRPLKGRLIVSCQAWDDDPFHGPGLMRCFAQAAIEGGAAGIRANGPEDVRDIKSLTGSVPVIAIQKRVIEDGKILITPTFEDAQALVQAGADAVAIDCTKRGQRYGALERLQRIQNELGVAVAADISTLEEALAAQDAGASFLLSTMRGYTDDTAHVQSFDAPFLAELVRHAHIPVIAEGRIWSPAEAQAAFEAGVFAVVVGSAITRPRDITGHYARRLRPWAERHACYLGVDLGGTNIKFGIVTSDGLVRHAGVEQTAIQAGRDAILDQVREIVIRLHADALDQRLRPLAVGVSTAGWPDPFTGRISYGTANLPDWTGADIAGAARSGAPDLPVYVENDANALAVGERCFGAAKGVDDFLCVTLGTGVGAGAYINGQLARGARFRGNALGHIIIEPDGLLCTCGKQGCLEPYANAAALLRYAGKEFGSARRVLGAAQSGDEAARAAILRLADCLSRGLAHAVALLDPALIVVSGGLAQDNPILVDRLRESIPVQIRTSALGYHGGVAGAGAIARSGLASGRA